jgi:hypothetical protein
MLLWLEGVQARSLAAVRIQANHLKRYGKQGGPIKSSGGRIEAHKRRLRQGLRVEIEWRHLRIGLEIGSERRLRRQGLEIETERRLLRIGLEIETEGRLLRQGLGIKLKWEIHELDRGRNGRICYRRVCLGCRIAT